MAQGTVKWFHAVMGYGFIAPDDGSASVLVPSTTQQREGQVGLRKGARVEYDTVPGANGRPAAVNLRVTADALPRGPSRAARLVPAAVKLGRRAVVVGGG